MSEWKVLEEGEIFEERYQIESVLGVGGFAHVYRARQVDLDREVALKILRPPPAAHGGDSEKINTWMERFRREAKVISRLRDPHTITMYDYGNTDRGMSYMVFEFVSGRSLDLLLAEQGAMPPQRVASILEQALQSIREAHSLGILHRDLKPANLLLYEHMDRDDRVKVLDFGIAKPMREADAMTNADLTTDGSILGTPRYMAPEQLKGENVGPASDIYSLGLVGYELLTGKKAVSGDTTMTVISQQLSPDPIELPRSIDVPAGLRSIINGMLSKAQDRRYSDAADVLTALKQWDADEAIRESDATVATDVTPPMIPQEHIEPLEALESSGEPAAAPATRRSTIAAASAAAVVVLGGVLFFIFAITGDSSADDPSATNTSAQAETATANSNDSENSGEDPPPEIGDDRKTDGLRILTIPSGAQIKVDGEEIGASPAKFDMDASALPLTITAVHDDGYRGSLSVEETTPEVEIRLEPSTTSTGRTEPDPASDDSATRTDPAPPSGPADPAPTDEPVRQDPDPAPPEDPPEVTAPDEPTTPPDHSATQQEDPPEAPPEQRPSNPFIPLDEE